MLTLLSRKAHSKASLVALGVAISAACSVDTADITFEEDDVYYPNGDGASDAGGATGDGGVASVAGVLNKAGSDNGSGGSASPGGKPTAGASAGGTIGTAGSGTGGMKPTTCTPAHADRQQPLIDDLEDGDALLPEIAGREAASWYAYNDGTGPQTPPIGPDPPLPERTTGAMGTRYAMHTTGGPFTEWGGGLGIVLRSVPNLPCPYDISQHAGLRFWVRGTTGTGVLRLQLPMVRTQQAAQGGTCQPTAQQDCGDHYGYDFPVPSDWGVLEIPWTALEQHGWGQPVNLDLTSILNIEFAFVQGEEIDFWVDELTFY